MCAFLSKTLPLRALFRFSLHARNVFLFYNILSVTLSQYNMDFIYWDRTGGSGRAMKSWEKTENRYTNACTHTREQKNTFEGRSFLLSFLLIIIIFFLSAPWRSIGPLMFFKSIHLYRRSCNSIAFAIREHTAKYASRCIVNGPFLKNETTKEGGVRSTSKSLETLRAKTEITGGMAREL